MSYLENTDVMMKNYRTTEIKKNSVERDEPTV